MHEQINPDKQLTPQSQTPTPTFVTPSATPTHLDASQHWQQTHLNSISGMSGLSGMGGNTPPPDYEEAVKIPSSPPLANNNNKDSIMHTNMLNGRQTIPAINGKPVLLSYNTVGNDSNLLSVNALSAIEAGTRPYTHTNGKFLPMEGSSCAATAPNTTPGNDRYKLYTIYDTDNDKLSGLPNSTTGSLSSIITGSIASSEPDPRAGAGGGAGDGGGPGDATSIAGVPGNLDEKLALNRPGIKDEKWQSILMQVSIPFLLAGIGTIGAGIILGRVEKWRVFKTITNLFILVPALLGLKGNLDMCLASRLSTQVNLGNMTSRSEVWRMIVGNIALVQVQATVASFLVAMFATAVGAAMEGTFNFEHTMLITAAAMFTATSSCFVLDFVLVAVIILASKYRLNPDNMATPLAASIGDVVSISLLSFMASMLFENIGTHMWINFAVVTCYAVLLPMWVLVVLKNKYARPVLMSGWTPVLSALCISGLGGLVLDAAVDVFSGFVVFQPIINGIGGNLVSVQASKISTMLHQTSIIGIIPPHTKIFEWPWRALFNGVPYAKTARILIALVVPGSLIFILVADYIHMSANTIGISFACAYLTASLLQVMLLLYIAHIIVHVMWKWKIDPDNSSIPYLTSIGDLLGSTMLAGAFLFLKATHREYAGDLHELDASK